MKDSRLAGSEPESRVNQLGLEVSHSLSPAGAPRPQLCILLFLLHPPGGARLSLERRGLEANDLNQNTL